MLSKKKIPYLLMIAPALLLFMVFHSYPVIRGLLYSFTNYRGWGKAEFVGLKNYINVFRDNRIWNAYGFTFFFAITATVIVNIVSLALAIGLNGRIYGRNLLRSIFFLPNVMSLLIIGFVFKYLFSQVLPQIFTSLGYTGTLTKSILGNPNTAWIGIVVVSVWQASAFNIILYLAGLQSIPGELYEAHTIDGGKELSKFAYITFPMIAPFFTINVVLGMKNFLLVFDIIMAMTEGGPGKATESVSLLIYLGGFEGGEFAYQSANAIVLAFIIATISIVQTKFLQKREVQL